MLFEISFNGSPCTCRGAAICIDPDNTPFHEPGKWHVCELSSNTHSALGLFKNQVCESYLIFGQTAVTPIMLHTALEICAVIICCLACMLQHISPGQIVISLALNPLQPPPIYLPQKSPPSTIKCQEEVPRHVLLSQHILQKLLCPTARAMQQEYIQSTKILEQVIQHYNDQLPLLLAGSLARSLRSVRNSLHTNPRTHKMLSCKQTQKYMGSFANPMQNMGGHRKLPLALSAWLGLPARPVYQHTLLDCGKQANTLMSKSTPAYTRPSPSQTKSSRHQAAFDATHNLINASQTSHHTIRCASREGLGKSIWRM